jgi:ComEC/Rec2-related protein
VKILIWVGVAFFQTLILKFNLFDYGLQFAEKAHLVAYHFLESHPSQWNWFYEAILIGRDEGLRSQPYLQSFFVLGLYHLIVVSGSHVLALEKIISVTFFFLPPKAKKAIALIFLILFCLVNRLQASCVRAFISWLVLEKKTPRPTVQGDIQMVVTCLCLILEPSWVKSLSFQLSCGATLGLAMAASFKTSHFLAKKFYSTFFCAAITSPLIFCVQPCLSWLVIPANTFAMPLFEGVLMPISLINILFRSMSFLTEKIFVFVFGLSDFFATFEKPLLCLDERKLSIWGIIYLFSVYFAWRFCLPWFFRQRFWQNQSNPKAGSSIGA